MDLLNGDKEIFKYVGIVQNKRRYLPKTIGFWILHIPISNFQRERQRRNFVRLQKKMFYQYNEVIYKLQEYIIKFKQF